ncbi:MAG TPA: condensation domain-containing protein [Pyrinomonadaceae bacterium]|jgi:acyl-CoA synthetase (AMP-forming)/AMP-acid ligase II
MKDKPSTVVELLRTRALNQPEHVVYTFLRDGENEESRLTHAELEHQARIIATRLQSLNMAGERVLLLYPPGLEYIAAFFGCLYAGAVAVPAYPPRPNQSLLRLQSIVADARPLAALTTTRILRRMETRVGEADALKRLAWLATDDLAAAEDDWREEARAADELAFFQYTSGSTGTPKGVMLTHSNLLHNAELVRRAMAHAPTDRYVSWLPTFHDMGFMAGILQPLYANISAVLMSPASFLQNPALWLQAIARHRATTSGAPNFAYDLCVRRARPAQLVGLDLSSWSVAFNGAEPVREETMRRFAEAFAPYGFRREAFYPCYGLAEATLMVSGGAKSGGYVAKTFDAEALEKNRAVEPLSAEASQRALVGCGKALGQQQVVIVHPDKLTACDTHEIGEIWVSGGSVAKGYWNRPDETAQTFHARLADTGDQTFLRTGDLGFVHGGELFVAGRMKDLIIIRGLNHYPQDIEQTAEQSYPSLRPGCCAAFTVTVAGEEQLVVVQEVEQPQQAQELPEIIDAIRRAVAVEHELQVYAVVLIKPSTIPKTSSGKIQRHLCRERFLASTLDEAARSLTGHSVKETGSRQHTRDELLLAPPEERLRFVEEYLRGRVAGVLKVSPWSLRLSQSLATAGLDSLAAAELKYRIESDLNVVVPLVKFLEGDSLSLLATQLLQLIEEAPSVEESAEITAVEEVAEHPLSPMQQAIWVLCELAPESAAYNVAFAADIAAALDADALRRALSALLERHSSLRATFHLRDGQPVQRIHETPQLHFETTDATRWSEQELRERLLAESHHPFDMERGPMFRVKLFSRSAREYVLLVTAHHIVIDGWSFWVLLDDLQSLYAAEKTGADASLPALDSRYTDYVYWSNAMLGQPEGERQWSYWQSRLSGELPLLDIPTSKPRPPVQTYPAASHHFTVSRQLTARLRKLAHAGQATLYMTLLAAYQVLLSRYTGQRDILVGSPISGRSRAAFENVVGCFFNVIVLRADFSANPSFGDFLQQVRQTVLGGLQHQDFPTHLLTERLHPTRDPSRPPLFQTTFILQKPHRGVADVFTRARDDGDGSNSGNNGGGSNGGNSVLPLRLRPLERRHARAELELEMIEIEGELSAWFHYNTDLFDAAMLERLTGHFLTLLDEIAERPDKRISHLTLLTEDERRTMLDVWSNARPPSVAGATTVQSLFEAQAQKNSEKAAAVADKSSLTFAELDAQANQLANLIMELVDD